MGTISRAWYPWTRVPVGADAPAAPHEARHARSAHAALVTFRGMFPDDAIVQHFATRAARLFAGQDARIEALVSKRESSRKVFVRLRLWTRTTRVCVSVRNSRALAGMCNAFERLERVLRKRNGRNGVGCES